MSTSPITLSADPPGPPVNQQEQTVTPRQKLEAWFIEADRLLSPNDPDHPHFNAIRAEHVPDADWPPSEW
jgi:hypothetical protein